MDSCGSSLPTKADTHAAFLPNDVKVSYKRLRIMDCRPEMYAKGNALTGKGHEVLGRLGGPNCTTLEFAGIDNIHAMRKSFAAMRMACFDAESPDYLQAVHQSRWLHHLSAILTTAIRVASQLERGDPVLIHCSDGWDRTAQVAAVAQVLLDPFYRTLDGFRILLFKDFESFGHKFRDRSGIYEVEEASPIFFQFLDAVWQIWRQQPWEFEFTEHLLEVLAYVAQTRFTADFAFNNTMERARARQGAAHSFSNETQIHVSVWAHIFSHREMYLNPLYCRASDGFGLRHTDQTSHAIAAAMMSFTDRPCRQGGAYFVENNMLSKEYMPSPSRGRGLAPAPSRDNLSETYWPQHGLVPDVCSVPLADKDSPSPNSSPQLFFMAGNFPGPVSDEVAPLETCEGPPSGSATVSNVSLLLPKCNIQQLAVWECMFFRTLPNGTCVSGTSAAFQNGIFASFRSSDGTQEKLLHNIQVLKNELEMERRKVENLKRVFEDAIHESINEETVLVLKHDDTHWDNPINEGNCKIMTTAKLFENYI